LLALLQTNHYFRQFCKNDNFWKCLFWKEFYPYISSADYLEKPDNRSWKKHYLLAIAPERTWTVYVNTEDSYRGFERQIHTVSKNACQDITVRDIIVSLGTRYDGIVYADEHCYHRVYLNEKAKGYSHFYISYYPHYCRELV
jgi:hypothetical protein